MLGAVALAVVFEAVVASYDLYLIRPEGLNWRSARQAARRHAPGCDVVCFGSSMAQVGLFPRVIEHQAGRPAFNLAVFGGRVESNYYLLRRALDAGARPSAVVVNMPPNLLTSYVGEESGCWSDALGTWDCLDMAWAYGDAGFFGRTMIKRALPSLAYRDQVPAVLRAAIRKEPTPYYLGNLFGMRNFNQNRGAVVSLKSKVFSGAVAANHALMLDRWSCDPVKRRYITRFLDLAASKGVRVYWVITPFSPALHAGRERQGLNAGYDRFVRSFLSYPNLVVVNGRYSGYGDDLFLDACHLAPVGAYSFSADLGDVIRRRDADVRWVSLPPFRPRRLEVPIENMLQSSVAILRPARRRGPAVNAEGRGQRKQGRGKRKGS